MTFARLKFGLEKGYDTLATVCLFVCHASACFPSGQC